MDPHAPATSLFLIHRTNKRHSCRDPSASITVAFHPAAGWDAENPGLTLITCGVVNGQGPSRLLLTDPHVYIVGSNSTDPVDSPSLNNSSVAKSESRADHHVSGRTPALVDRLFSFPTDLTPFGTFPQHSALSFSLPPAALSFTKPSASPPWGLHLVELSALVAGCYA